MHGRQQHADTVWALSVFAYVQDPFPKPCYLFALVAGDLMVKEDSFTTSSGRNVALRIYTQPANINQVGGELALVVCSFYFCLKF